MLWLQNLEQERAALVDRAHRVLDEIERSVLRSNPRAALLMLTEFLEGNENVLSWRRQDDSAVSQLFARAVALARAAATNLPPEEWQAALERPEARH